LMSDSDVFGRGICISPSVWWNDRSVLDRFDAYDGELPLRLWIDVGTNESWMPEILDVLPPDDPTYDHSQAIRGARDMAMSKGMTMGVDLGYYEAIGSFHDVNAVRDRISSLLAFALSDVALTDATISDHDFHVWHEYVEAPPPVHPPAQVTTVSFETRFDSPFVLTWPNDMVTLSSRDEDIATIDADGMVTAVGEGTATFDASFMGLTAEDSVEVRVVVP